MQGTLLTNGIRVAFLPINRAWAVMWHDSPLRIFRDRRDALDHARELCAGDVA